MLAAVVDRLAGPGGREDLERLVEHPCAPAVVELLARLRVLAAELIAAQTDAERQPAAAEPVQRRGLPGDLDRPAPGQRCDHRAEPDPLGGGCHRRERDLWIGHRDHGRPPAHVVPDEHAVPAGVLGLGRQVRDERGVGQLVEGWQEQP